MFYIYREVVNEIMESLRRYPWLMSVDALESHMHKKLALLVALKPCYTKIEELIP